MANGNSYESSAVAGVNSTQLPRASWLRRLLILGACGLALFFAAIIYGVLIVGVPDQDPTPEMARLETFHLDVSGWGMAIGGTLALLAFIGSIVILISRAVARLRA